MAREAPDRVASPAREGKFAEAFERLGVEAGVPLPLPKDLTVFFPAEDGRQDLMVEQDFGLEGPAPAYRKAREADPFIFPVRFPDRREARLDPAGSGGAPPGVFVARRSLTRIRERIRRSDLAGALELLCPALRGRLPAGLAALYGFVGEQDLSGPGSLKSWIGPDDLSEVFARARALGRSAPEGPLLAGFALLCARRYADACRQFEEAERLAPSHPKASLCRAAALWLRGDRDRTRRWLPQALEAVGRAVSLDGPSRESLLLRAQIRLEFEDNTGGLADLGRLLERDPHDIEARIGRAEVLADSFRYRLALEDTQAVLAASKGAWWAFAQRGRLRGMCGRLPGALADLTRAIELESGCGALYAWRGEVLRKQGRYGQARLDLDEAIRRDPAYAFGWECRGRLGLTVGDLPGALRDLGAACRLDPAHTLAFAWRGEARLKAGLLREAWADFDRVFPLEPRTLWNAPVREGERPDRAAREAAFWSDLDRAVRLAPADPVSWCLRGRFRSSLGQERPALADLTRAAGLARAAGHRAQEGSALAWRGRALLRLAAPRRALSDLEAAVALTPRCGLFRAWKADALLAVGAEPEALSEYDRALRRPARGLAPAFLARARIRTRARLWGLARGDYETAFVLDTKSKQARRGLALSERKLQQERN